MKKYRKVTLQITTAFIGASFIVLLGLFFILSSISNLIKSYEKLVVEGTDNALYMDKINKLSMQEQLVCSNYVLSTSDENLAAMETEERRIRFELNASLEEFGNRMRGSEKEQIYHDISSSCYSYFSDISIAMKLRKDTSKTIAQQYMSKNLLSSFTTINKNILTLSDYIQNEVDTSKKYMGWYSRTALIWVFITGFTILFFLIAAFIIVTNLTARLEKNKNSLQVEVENKAKELTVQNNKLIYIQEQTIIGMANLIESRDGETGEHVKRTSMYVDLLVRAAKDYGYHREILSDHYIELLKKAAPMHDVGKIAISDKILKKPAKLSSEEFESIKSHTTAGSRIISKVLSNIESTDYLQIATDVAMSHHEHWDGNGYPQGLKGEQIPLSARIMAIADVFDAMVSPRCYKAAIPAEEAFDFIEKSSGTHFDPILVDLFLKKKADILMIMASS